MIETELPIRPEASAFEGWVIVVDAGATKSQALGSWRGSETRREHTTGSGNVDSAGPSVALSNVIAAIEGVAAGEPVSGLLLACAGTDTDVLRRGIEAHFHTTPHIDVVNDVIGAWAATTLGADGVALISGTGSHGIGVAGTRAVRVGGWGHIVGDEGSAYAIGRAALSAASHAEDGRGPATALREAALSHFEAESVGELVAAVYRWPEVKSRLAGFARVVDRAVGDGDEVAAQIVDAAGAALALHVAALAQVVAMTERTPIGLVGSTWHSDALREAFGRALTSRGGALARLEPRVVERSPAEGLLKVLHRNR